MPKELNELSKKAIPKKEKKKPVPLKVAKKEIIVKPLFSYKDSIKEYEELCKPKRPKKKVAASKVVSKPKKSTLKKHSLSTMDKFDYISGEDVLKEIRKNKDCYVMDGSDTAVVFTKKVEISVTKINENSVFQPHEKTNKNVYCVMVVFEFNEVMKLFHPRRFGMQNISRLYEPYVERGAKVYMIRDISEIADVIKGIE